MFSTLQINNTKVFMEKNHTDNIDTSIRKNPLGWNSLFIPMLPPSMIDEQKLTDIVENKLTIGKVKRVDIVAKPNTQNRFMAFIHFDYWYYTYETNLFRQNIEKNNQVDVFGYIESYRYLNKSNLNDNIIYTDWNNNKCYPLFNGQFYVPDENFYNNATLYIRFMINKTPIPETELNQHQLANNLSIAEKEIVGLKERILELENIIMKMAENKNDKTGTLFVDAV